MQIVTILCIIIFTKLLNAFGHINMNIYQNLPPLYEFDNYDQCLSQPLSTYCMVFAEIESNNYSDIWYNIKTVSSDFQHHFRHDNLFFGVCMKQCNELLKQLTPLEMEQLSRNKSVENEITKYYQKVHKRDDAYVNRVLYQNLVDKCLNYGFKRKYNLTLLTSIEYCEKSEMSKEIDSLDITFYIIITILIVLNTVSSLYDYRLKYRQPISHRNNDFYKKNLKNIDSLLLTSFSICRNYYRLISVPQNENSDKSDFKFTYAFRVFTLIIVILGHGVLLVMSTQIQNPEFFEERYHSTFTILFQNGTAFLQIFFVLTGFFIKLKFDKCKLITPESSYKKSILVYIQGFLSRYLRFLPSLIMVILFNATLLIRLQDGPFWRHALEAEYIFCREQWWKNLFMINNFMLKDSCAQHTWFLAADMQLYELFLFTMILTAKFKSLKKPLYILIAIFAFLVPSFLTYFYKLDAIVNLPPEGYRYLYFKDMDTFYITYPQFYCNLCGYLVGVICAEIYMKYIQNPHPNKDKYTKYRGVLKYELALLTLIAAITIGLLLSGNLVVNINVDKPSLWFSLYAGLYRNIWAIFSGFILLCMLLKMGWIAYEIACLPMFRFMGKISFQSYLWHVAVFRILLGFYRQPIYVNTFFIICHIILGFVLSNILAFFMALFLEYPIGEIIHYILRPRIPNARKDVFDDKHIEMKSNTISEIDQHVKT